MSSVTLLVIAKEPLPGRAKTRLTPPCSPTQAAALARASLRDTLDVVAHTPAARRVLVFEGDARTWRPDGFDVLSQRGYGLGARLAAAFADVTPPALLVGMDTPQLTPQILGDAARALEQPEVDAVLAPTLDGGYWGVGFTNQTPGAFERVTMSSRCTCREQRARFSELGLRTHEPPLLRDVDTIEDARAVAGLAPETRFARAFAALA
jgi:rSAM/selenodomain-associated transferase 1